MTPTGMGIYFGRLGHVWAPAEGKAIIAKLKVAKIQHAALLVEAIDGWQTSMSVMESNSKLLRDAGVKVSVYSLPSSVRAKDAAGVSAVLIAAAKAAQAAHVILDAEEAYRGKALALRTALQILRTNLQPGQSLGVTTYGRVHAVGSSYPWDELKAADWCGHQVYETAGSDAKVDAFLGEMAVLMGGKDKVIPHLAVYPLKGATAEGTEGPSRLKGDFSRACLDNDSKPLYPGMWVWSWASLDDDEAKVMGDLAKLVNW